MSFQLSEINYKTVTDPKGFVQECDAVYHEKVEQAAQKLGVPEEKAVLV